MSSGGRGSEGLGQGWDGGMNDYYYGSTQEVEEVSYGTKEKPMVLKGCCLCAVLAMIFFFFICLNWYPYDGSYQMDPMIAGENVNLCDFYPTFWFSEVTAYSDAQVNVQGLFYFNKCPELTVNRSVHYSCSIGDTSFHYEGFYLNKGSQVNLNWNATQRLFFAVYIGRAAYQQNSPVYSEKGVSSMYHFGYEAPKNGYYIFYWSSPTKSSFEGAAVFDFLMRSYDTTKADDDCPLGIDSCSYPLKELSCAVVDVYNLTYDGYVNTHIDYEGRGGKYFGIVMTPFLVLSLLFLGIWHQIKG